MNVRWEVDSGETNLPQGFFGNTSNIKPFLTSEISKAQERSICKNFFSVVVVGCASATLYNLFAYGS